MIHFYKLFLHTWKVDYRSCYLWSREVIKAVNPDIIKAAPELRGLMENNILYFSFISRQLRELLPWKYKVSSTNCYERTNAFNDEMPNDLICRMHQRCYSLSDSLRPLFLAKFCICFLFL